MLRRRPLNSRDLLASELTPRELDVLKLICEGYSVKQIASLLNLSWNTVRIHRLRLLKNSAAENPIGLFRWALKNGYVRLDEGQPKVVRWPRKETSVREMLPVLRGSM